MSERRKTAAELMAELQGDPAFRQRELEAEQERLRRERQNSLLLEPLSTKLREHGLQGASLEEIVQKSAPLPSKAIEVLLLGLSELGDARASEGVVRALGAAKEAFDGRLLVACFERTDDEGLKWAILNTIALTSPHSIDDWLEATHNTPRGETLRRLSDGTGSRPSSTPAPWSEN
jgi:hypothetical protein